jgi:hypothetical protein
MEKRYGALRIIATVYKIIGVIWGILAFIGAVVAFVGSASFINFGFNSSAVATIANLFAALIILIFGLMGALAIYGVGELVYLLINIEENTRYSAIVLRDRLAAPQPAQQPVMPQPPAQPPM